MGFQHCLGGQVACGCLIRAACGRGSWASPLWQYQCVAAAPSTAEEATCSVQCCHVGLFWRGLGLATVAQLHRVYDLFWLVTCAHRYITDLYVRTPVQSCQTNVLGCNSQGFLVALVGVCGGCRASCPGSTCSAVVHPCAILHCVSNVMASVVSQPAQSTSTTSTLEACRSPGAQQPPQQRNSKRRSVAAMHKPTEISCLRISCQQATPPLPPQAQ